MLLLWRVHDGGRQGGLLNLTEEINADTEPLVPSVVFQVPVIAIAGSGGGFRAMVGFAGVMKALFESDVLDCATYVAGLSGSTWLVLL